MQLYVGHGERKSQPGWVPSRHPWKVPLKATVDVHELIDITFVLKTAAANLMGVPEGNRRGGPRTLPNYVATRSRVPIPWGAGCSHKGDEAS